MYSQWAPSPTDYRLRGATDAAVVPAAQFEFGGRVWYSSGRFQKDLGGLPDQSLSNLLVSRLTYNSSAATGELFTAPSISEVADKAAQRKSRMHLLPYGIPLCLGFISYLVYLHGA